MGVVRKDQEITSKTPNNQVSMLLMGLNNVESTDKRKILENRHQIDVKSENNVNANDEMFALAA